MSDYKSIFDSLSDVIFVHDSVTGKIVYVNEKCLDVYGYSPNEIIKQGLTLLSIKEEEYNFKIALDRIKKAASGLNQTFEWKTKRSNGSIFWVEVQLSSTSIEGQKRVVAFVRDITAKIDAKRDLERREKFQNAINLITQSLFAKTEEHEILWGLVDSCVEVLSFDDLVVYMKDENGNLVPRAASGRQLNKQGRIKDLKILTPGQGIVGNAFRVGKSILTKDVSKNKKYLADGKPKNSEITIPIKYGKEVIGIIDSEHSELGFYNNSHVEILETIASFAAVKIIEARAVLRMKSNENRLQAILEASPDLIFIIDKKGRYLEAYTAHDDLLAAPKDQLIGTTIGEYLSSEEAIKIQKAIKKVIKTGKSEVHEYMRRSNIGAIKWFSTKMSRLNYEGQDAVILLSRDITTNKLIQKRVIESEKLLTSINQNITDGIYRSYPQNRLAYVNLAFAKMFGYKSVEVLMAQSPDSLYANPEDRKRIIDKISTTKQIANEEVLFRKEDGSTFWGALSSTLTTDPDGYPIIDGAVRDITENKLNQKKILRNQQLLQAINRNISEGLYRSYLTGGLIYVNDAFARMFGYDSAKEILKIDSECLYSEPENRVGGTLHNKLKLGQRDSYETMFKRKNGTTFLGLNTFILTKDHEGNEVFDGAVRDITDERLSQQKIQESQRLLESINTNISEGIYRSYAKGGLIYANEAFAKMFGYDSAEEILKVDSISLYAKPSGRRVISKEIDDNKIIKDKENLFKRKDGSTFWGLVSSILVEDQNGVQVYDGAIRDITENKLIQKQIAKNQEQLESINRNISEGIYRSYAKGGLVYANEAFAKMFGYDSPEDILSVKSLSLYAKPTDRKGATPNIQEIGYVTNNEVLFKRKDGSTFWGSNSYILATDEDGEKVFDGAVRDISVQKEYAEKLSKLNEELLERNKTLALKEKELETSNEELRSNSESLVETLDKLSERNFELDQLVYRTSHDLRAPLRSVLGLTNLMKIEKAEHIDDFLEKIDERILNMDDFIKAMLDYSRASRMALTFEDINIEEIINNCMEDLKYLEGFNEMDITSSFVDNKKDITCDRLRLKIIFGNIISNAYKYRDVNKKKSLLRMDISIGKEEAIFKFEDNGIGIYAKYLDKVFDMFFRATEKSDGSGLGMYIVKQSVEKLGGNIDVKSKKGKGTCFEISIPCF